jgi:hypothetical protein
MRPRAATPRASGLCRARRRIAGRRRDARRGARGRPEMPPGRIAAAAAAATTTTARLRVDGPRPGPRLPARRIRPPGRDGNRPGQPGAAAPASRTEGQFGSAGRARRARKPCCRFRRRRRRRRRRHRRRRRRRRKNGYWRWDRPGHRVAALPARGPPRGTRSRTRLARPAAARRRLPHR